MTCKYFLFVSSTRKPFIFISFNYLHGLAKGDRLLLGICVMCLQHVSDFKVNCYRGYMPFDVCLKMYLNEITWNDSLAELTFGVDQAISMSGYRFVKYDFFEGCIRLGPNSAQSSSKMYTLPCGALPQTVYILKPLRKSKSWSGRL